MKQLLITIAAVLLVGCGESQQSTPAPESKPEPSTAKAPNISIVDDAYDGNIEAVKQHLAAGTDVNAKNEGMTPLHWVAYKGCLLYTSPSPRDRTRSRMPSSA